jgi:hypothetical protein
MYTEEELTSAVEAGILTEAAAEAFRAHVAGMQNGSAVDDERFRLVTGFNDIFVVIACALLLASVATIGATIAPWSGAAAAVVAAWGLAEFFVRKRHMALPAIVLAIVFVGGLVSLGVGYVDHAGAGWAVGSVAALFGAWLHWWRFRVPITVALGVAAAVGVVVTLLLAVVPEALNWTTPIALVAGLVVFVLALRWDAADPARLTRKSDVAFWLHLLAAPLLVRAVFGALGISEGGTTLGNALAVVALYAVIALVSLSIDRRALLVAALGYVLYTFSALLNQHGVVSLSFAITALVTGSALLLLSAFWHRCRALVLQCLPAGLQSRLARPQ